MQSTEEVCPSCGKFVTTLVPDTGFCESCTGISIRVCVRCKTEFKSRTPDYVCDPCIQEDYNQIEILMVEGMSLTRARVKVAENNRAFCLRCGDYMPRALKGRHMFCAKKPGCRRAFRRLKYYREMLGMDKEDALERVMFTLEQEKRDEAILAQIIQAQELGEENEPSGDKATGALAGR